MHQIDLTEEERQKLRELWMSPEFKKARKAMKRSFYLEESPVLPFFILFSTLPFLSIFLFPILMYLGNHSTAFQSIFLLYDKYLSVIVGSSLLAIVGVYIIAAILSIIFKIIKIPDTKEVYLNRILPPMMRIILPKAEFDGNNNLPLNAFKKAVPIFSYYYPAGLLDLQEQPELKITDLYAYSPQREKTGKVYTNSTGKFILYNIILILKDS